MASLLKRLLSGGSNGLDQQGHMHQSPSFNDFSLGSGDDAERELQADPVGSPSSPLSTQSSIDKENTQDVNTLSSSPVMRKSQDVWKGTFHPGRNFNMLKDGKPTTNYFDHVADPKASPTTWQYILKSEHMRALEELRTSKGYLDADDLRSKLGPAANVDELIRQADKNGDGKIDYYEFSAILKNS